MMKPMSKLMRNFGILRAAALILCALSGGAWAQTAPYAPPLSPRAKLNFDLNWKFIREDVPGAEAPGFDDSAWTTVSTPHTFNDVDSFRQIINHSGGDRGTHKRLAWYRKNFKLPAKLAGDKIFLEFEGMRQAGDIFLNGKPVGLYENGVTAYGLDISGAFHFGNQENVLAVKVDNRTTYVERSSNTSFEWNANDFNPDHGGINRHVWLHVTGKIYQTLPLYYGLESTGVYVHAGNFNIAGKSADVTVESEVRNASGDRSTVELSAVIVDRKGQVRARFDGSSVDMVDGEKTVLSATGAVKGARFWSPEDPYLYDVYTILKVDGKTVDVNSVATGFRKTEFKGGAGTGGVYLNDKFVYLKGFAQRSSNEWAGLGQAYPDWMHDYQAQLIRDNHANYVRWMHIAPQRVDADTADRYGIIQICPGGDRVMGARGNDNVELNTATTPIAEFYGVMIGQDPRTDQLNTPTAMFRGYSAQRRDRAPLIETEDFREEGARRFWDDYSPPYFGFEKGPNDTWQFTSESFALAAVNRYRAYWDNRISNPDPAHSKWSGYASIYFSDSDADGRQDSSEV